MDSFSPQTTSQREYPSGFETVSLSTSFVQPITRTAYSIPADERGTYESLRLMACAVRGEMEPDYSGYKDEFNRRAADQAVSSSGAKTRDGVIAALFAFVRDGIRYIDHPPHQQVVQDCRRTLELGSGDCVSKSVCLSTLLATQGIESQFVAQHPSHESGFSHVYVEIVDDGLALDSICDGKDGRPIFGVGDRSKLSDEGFELSWSIF